ANRWSLFGSEQHSHPIRARPSGPSPNTAYRLATTSLDGDWSMTMRCAAYRLALKLRATRPLAQVWWTNVPCPPGHEHDGFPQNDSARQLQALVRQRALATAVGESSRSGESGRRPLARE